ncbi:hypothetical protein [Salinibacillus xinjiangensis]|uniref:Uncharacterized protein n=1 Tax=Salinibacillus xinjiangensis TaxID=1229268 RepID=A0A6G1XBM4_9BACI|nr:hypothetical protein [Salinibacillus xinjiangensis]MRG88332.1 hypothetical protein [Salinibacillus xinjiangensis]
MENNAKMLSAVRYIGSTVLSIGILLFLFGVYDSGFGTLASIGIGTVMGAIFIFLMGVFFVATEEVLEKTERP